MFKKTVQLLIILGILSVIFYLVHHQQGADKQVPYFNIDSTRIGRIDIATQDEKVIIQKKADRWELVSPIRWDVSKDQINLFFSKALKVKVIKTPVSEDIKNQDRYRVTPDKAIELIIYDKRMHLMDKVFLGKSLNNSFCYARRPGTIAIFQLQDNIYDDIAPSIFLWRSPVIASVVLQNLVKIEVKYTGSKYKLKLENQVWYYEDGRDKFQISPTNTAAGKLFNALTSLQTYQFIDNHWKEFEQYFQKPAAVVSITDRFGKTIRFTFAISKNNTVYLMKNDDKNTLYIMNIDMLNRFTIAAQHFKTPN
jgi:hypothetical protein